MQSSVDLLSANAPYFNHCCGSYQQLSSTVWLCGQVFAGDEILTSARLCNDLQQAIANHNLAALLQYWDGFFSIIVRYTHGWWLISDKLRSRPLFYRHTASGWKIADNARQLLLATDTIDAVAEEEYLHCGYVTGSGTLIANLYQLEAAQIIQLADKSPHATTSYYSVFWPQNAPNSDLTEAQWHSELDQALTAATARLIKLAAGRTILLPLSGGYDSRALAIYLKKSAYSNVQCFTFGKANSFEITVAENVSKTLGFPLHKVLYTAATWKKLKACQRFANYQQIIHNLCSVPNVQVYPALQYLLDNGLITTEVLVVPGHTGDFVSGGHIPAIAGSNDLISALNAIIKRHYDFNREPLSQALVTKLQAQLEQMWPHPPTAVLAISAAEAWNYRERQVKFIVNSNRYYDFWQLDWWMPLWDWQFVSVWQNVPLALRRNKRLWINFVNSQFVALGGTADTTAKASKADKLLTLVQRYLPYFFDHNHIYRLLPFSWWLKARLKLTKNAPAVFPYLAQQSLIKLKSLLKARQD